jgi:hypothetical protein
MEESQMEKIEITAAELAEFHNLKVELKQRRVEDRVKTLGNNKVIWRHRIALRRIDIKEHAPDIDLVAYDAIHKLKNPSSDSKQKVTVSDNEIVAYKVLDPDFNKTVTLAEVLDKVSELKGSGKLTVKGDEPLIECRGVLECT